MSEHDAPAPGRVRQTLAGVGPTLLLIVITVALALVVIAPAVLSSSDILRWATSPHGLNLKPALAWLAFIALDAAAVVCVGMSTYAAEQGENGGAFRALTWAFSAGSAWFNYRFGLTTSAPDDEMFFPAMSLAGPVLLELMLKRIRSRRRQASGVQRGGRPRFGLRWLVSFTETRRAWLAAVREGIPRADEAIAFVRESQQLQGLSAPEQLLLAWQALGTDDVPAARSWLAARQGSVVTSDDERRARLLLSTSREVTPTAAPRELVARPASRPSTTTIVRVGVTVPAVNDLTTLVRQQHTAGTPRRRLMAGQPDPVATSRREEASLPAGHSDRASEPKPVDASPGSDAVLPFGRTVPDVDLQSAGALRGSAARQVGARSQSA